MTTNILGDVVTETLGDVADVEVLMPGNADPHTFSISAAQAERLADADLVVANGLGLEGGVLDNVDAAEDVGTPVLELAPLLDPMAFDSDASDDVGLPDPHVWTDPRRIVTAVELIADAAGEELPGIDESAMRVGADSYADDVRAMDRRMKRRLAAIPPDDRVLVTNHHVFGYFAERYHFEIIGTVLPSGTTLASPSASDLEDLVTVIGDADVPAIFADSSHSQRLADVLADEVGVDVDVVPLFSESLGGPGSGAETYLEMLATNTDRITATLVP